MRPGREEAAPPFLRFGDLNYLWLGSSCFGAKSIYLLRLGRPDVNIWLVERRRPAAGGLNTG